MPTVLGVVFVAFGIYYFFFKQEGLLGLLIVASVFQGSSAITFGERGIPCYYIVELFIILRAMASRFFSAPPRISMPHGKWLLTFAAVAAASALILPLLFAGVSVYDPLIGIDAGLFERPPLHLSLTNVTQAVYVLLDLMTAYSVINLTFSAKSARRAWIFAFYFVAFCVYLQVFCQLTGVPFPSVLVRNNPGAWDLANSPGIIRKPATFLEPSFAGAFLAMCSIGFLAQYLGGKGSFKRVTLSLLASGMVTSSGSLFTLGLCSLGLLLKYTPFRLPWYVDVARTKRIAAILLLVVGPLIVGVVASSEYRALLLDITVAKGDTGSFFNRTAADLFALQLLVYTKGIGVGLGSNRASSLITTLASNVGVVGLIAFAIFVSRTFKKVPAEDAWLRWSGFALVLNMCVDVPDVLFPTLWIAIMLALSLSAEPSGRRDLMPKLAPAGAVGV